MEPFGDYIAPQYDTEMHIMTSEVRSLNIEKGWRDGSIFIYQVIVTT